VKVNVPGEPTVNVAPEALVNAGATLTTGVENVSVAVWVIERVVPEASTTVAETVFVSAWVLAIVQLVWPAMFVGRGCEGPGSVAESAIVFPVPVTLTWTVCPTMGVPNPSRTVTTTVPRWTPSAGMDPAWAVAASGCTVD
jgi:hypothetical protein